MQEIAPVKTIEEIGDPKKFIPSSIALQGSNGEVVHTTSELMQAAYLQSKGILPIGRKLRRWTKKSVGGDMKNRAKVYFLYHPTPELDMALAEFINDHNGCQTLMRAYDAIRAFSFRQISD